MSDLKFNCPHCEQHLEAPEEILGKKIECPSCKGHIQLPEPEPKVQTSYVPSTTPDKETTLEQSNSSSSSNIAETFSPQENASSNINPIISASKKLLMGVFNSRKKKEKKKEKSPIATTALVTNRNTSLSAKGLTIHEDLKELIWIGDGKLKNYTQSKGDQNSFEIDGYRITISFHNQEEPSLIYTNQKISKPKDFNSVERPPYYPTYSQLTPEQKWVYLTLLLNPYNDEIDIGFVFILYYGLERHLLSGDFEKAISVVLKLRDVHTNKSFQSYSANAVVLSCMLHKRGELVLDFINSLDKEHELIFSDNLFLICYYSFEIPLLPRDIMRMSSTFEFDNRNYIKKYPDLFLKSLTESIRTKLGLETIDLKKYLTASEIRKVKQQEVSIFANMSISDTSIPIPRLSESFKLKREMYNFLEEAHNDVKKKLAEMRKAGKTIPSKKSPAKPKKEIVFDENQEKDLLNEVSKNQKNPVKRHFSYIQLQDFYYKYRSVDDKYLNKCINFCKLDLDSLSEMNEAYIFKEIKFAKQFASYSETKILNKEIEEIKENGFVGNIPAFKRLVIIYDKLREFENAIEICNKAIEYGQSTEDFAKRKEKLMQKNCANG
ncbi:MAG: TerB N-terminal domain-containing protein [Kiritimatiellae bacterium]|jgi:hypothetical protein|nr:TerB N-terminal domain-containing protein [Kiritimatiellia bacterium]